MKYTVPTTQQVCNQLGFGLDKEPNTPLEIFTNTRGQSEASDLAKLLGLTSFCDPKQIIDDPYWWIYCPENKLSCFPNFYDRDKSVSTAKLVSLDQKLGIKPFLTPDETSHLLPETKHYEKAKNNEPILVYTLGQYPQSVVNQELSDELTDCLKWGDLKTTGKHYTFCKNMVYPFDTVQLEECPEYVFKNNKYICVTAKESSYSQYDTLSDNSQFEKDKKYWIKIEPLEWYVDKTGHWITKNIVLSGIPFHTDKKIDSLDDTYIYEYLNSHFKQEFERTLQAKTLLNYKAYLLSELNKATISEKRLDYMLLLSQISLQYLKKEEAQAETGEYQSLKNEIALYTKNLLSTFQKNEDLTPNKAVQQLKRVLQSEKDKYFNKLPNRKKVLHERTFLQHFMPKFSHTKE